MILAAWLPIALAQPVPEAALDALEEQMLERTGTFEVVYPAPLVEGPAGIVNGGTAVGDYDNVVALAYIDPASDAAFTFCSGSLIHDEWVLTAAHCVEGLQDDYFGMKPHVLWGTELLFGGYEDAIPIVEHYADPTYNSSQFINDAAVVKLGAPKTDVQWMVLNDAEVDAGWVGTDLTFFGFGVTGDNKNDSGTKRTTVVPIQSVDEYNIMTYSSETNVCQGDSGGPSTFEGPDGPEQIGVNAFVTPSCNGGSAGSTRVDNHIGFIQQYVPEVALSYADLPVDEEPGAAGGGLHWLDDLAFDAEVEGLGGRWPEREGGVGGGCATAPGLASGWLALFFLAMRRRR